MTEAIERLDSVFASLADHTRRDILRRVAKEELSVGELAEHYDLTFAAVSKHLIMLEKADLIRKRRLGRQHLIQLKPAALKQADAYLERYRQLWEARLDRLEQYLKEENNGRKADSH